MSLRLSGPSTHEFMSDIQLIRFLLYFSHIGFPK